jgi:probable HAF family extracellular repeat protein
MDPFLWQNGAMKDLGTLGGNNGVAYWISDTGTVVGAADMPGSQAHHGFQWQNGTMRDLPPTGNAPCSNAFAVNVEGQAVGNETDCQGNSLAAVLWEHGSAYDINTLIGQPPCRSAAQRGPDRGEAFPSLVVRYCCRAGHRPRPRACRGSPGQGRRRSSD